LRMKQMMTV